MRNKLSKKQKANIGRLSWWVLFLAGGYVINLVIDDRYYAAPIIFAWGAFVYLINPYILKDLKIW